MKLVLIKLKHYIQIGNLILIRIPAVVALTSLSKIRRISRNGVELREITEEQVLSSTAGFNVVQYYSAGVHRIS